MKTTALILRTVGVYLVSLAIFGLWAGYHITSTYGGPEVIVCFLGFFIVSIFGALVFRTADLFHP